MGGGRDYSTAALPGGGSETDLYVDLGFARGSHVPGINVRRAGPAWRELNLGPFFLFFLYFVFFFIIFSSPSPLAPRLLQKIFDTLHLEFL